MAKARTATDADYAALGRVNAIYRKLIADTEAHIARNPNGPGKTASRFQHETWFYTRVTPARIRRLTDLGWLERRPTDGFGPELAVLSHAPINDRRCAG